MSFIDSGASTSMKDFSFFSLIVSNVVKYAIGSQVKNIHRCAQNPCCVLFWRGSLSELDITQRMCVEDEIEGARIKFQAGVFTVWVS